MSFPTPESATNHRHHDVVIIGAGAGGIATASSLLKRQGDLDIAVIDPRDTHDYQPGWTMVGGGVFSAESTRRTAESVIPKSCSWYQASAKFVQPDTQT